MDRRTLLKAVAGAGTLAATGKLSAPALAQGAAARTLRFVPQADLANFDPIWGTQYVVRNASAMVWDTLYGMDEKLEPQRQMAEAEEVSADGLIWTFRLRPGLELFVHAIERVPHHGRGIAHHVLRAPDRVEIREIGLRHEAQRARCSALGERRGAQASR